MYAPGLLNNIDVLCNLTHSHCATLTAGNQTVQMEKSVIEDDYLFV